MKKIYIFAFLASAFLISGCAREEVRDNEGSKGELVFRVSLDELTTKTTTPGVGAENTVSTLDFIIFQSDGTFLYKWHVDAPTPTAGYYEQTAKVSTIGGNTAILQKAKTLAIANYPGDGSVFAGKTLAQVQALAMVADNGTTNAASTGKFIYALADGSYQTLTTPSFVMTSTLGSFDKDADDLVSEVTLRRVAAKVSLTLNYTYDPNDPEGTAITTPGPTLNGHSTTTLWMPMIGDNTRVYLDNGALDATLNGLAATPGVFRYADNHPSYDTNTTNPFYTYPLSWTAGSDRAPFIKIIQPWHYVTVDNVDPTHPVLDENVVELYYKVMFPGITMLESNTWYHPTVTLDVLGGEADDPVELTGIGMYILGWGDVPSTGAGSLEDINLEPAKYLVPEFHKITVHNGHGAVIYYIASSKPTVTVNSIYKDVFTNDGHTTKYLFKDDLSPNYRTVEATLLDVFNGINTVSGHVGEILTPYTDGYWFENNYNSTTGEGQIILHHTLSGSFFEADGTTPVNNFAARPYTYNLTLSLDGVNDQSITITQYPPLSVEGIMSTGWVCINGTTSNEGYTSMQSNPPTANSTTHYSSYQPVGAAFTGPYVGLPSNRFIHMRWVNSSAVSDRDKVNNLGSVNTYNYLNPAGNNACRWLLIVKPSVVEGRYIMDPRVKLPLSSSDDLFHILNEYSSRYQNATTDIVSNASPLSATEYANLVNYTPASPSASSTVAPEFMFASSYGKTQNINFLTSVLRCAAYQEDGYPAGRWRLPTEAEMEMALDLADRKAIPELFLQAGKYWASSGRYLYYSSGWKWGTPSVAQKTFRTSYSGTDYQIAARCVYDTWYWGREEEDALKLGVGSTFGTDFSAQQYQWSGYSYTTK